MAAHYRNRFMMFVVAVRMLGMCIGVVWALPARVSNGHFLVTRRRRWKKIVGPRVDC
jgi:hypothetical protein